MYSRHVAVSWLGLTDASCSVREWTGVHFSVSTPAFGLILSRDQRCPAGSYTAGHGARRHLAVSESPQGGVGLRQRPLLRDLRFVPSVAGAAAGQTVPHAHGHVIPRYAGDMGDPRGGVRHVIPGKGNVLAGLGHPHTSPLPEGEGVRVFASPSDTPRRLFPNALMSTGKETGEGSMRARRLRTTRRMPPRCCGS